MEKPDCNQVGTFALCTNVMGLRPLDPGWLPSHVLKKKENNWEGEGGTPLFGLKSGIDFDHYGFQGNHGSLYRFLSFQLQMNS